MKRLPTVLSTNHKSLPDREFSFVRVALDVPLHKFFDYSLPEAITARIGDRVAVRFGAQQKIGIVIEERTQAAVAVERIKPIIALRDDAPRLPPDWIALMRFLSGYYQRPLGETMVAALPPRLRSTKPLPRKALEQDGQAFGARFIPNHRLNSAQAAVLERIPNGFGTFLLHGVTGSGKTEVYLHLVARTLQRGLQALVLVPEISLTPQLEARFRADTEAPRIGQVIRLLVIPGRFEAELEPERRRVCEYADVRG